MRKSFIAAALAAAIALAAGYAADASQHRKPNEPAQEGQQTAQPRPPPQATPNQDRPRRGPERGPVIGPYPGWPWWAAPYGYPPTPWRIYAEWETASVRLDVSPKESEVYVDRYFAGIVDDFDGIFQG